MKREISTEPEARAYLVRGSWWRRVWDFMWWTGSPSKCILRGGNKYCYACVAMRVFNAVLYAGGLLAVAVWLSGCRLTDPEPKPEPVRCWPAETCGDTSGGMVGGGA